MQDPLRAQQDPAQTQPDTQGARRRRHIITGPAVGMLLSGAAAVPVAGATGWRPTWVTALLAAFAASAVWFAASTAAGRGGDSDRDRIRGEASLRQALADVALLQDAQLAETRNGARLTWRVLHILRQQQRAGRRVRVSPDRAARDRLDAIERTLTAAAAGAFDPATQAALRSINQDLAAR